MNATLLLCKQGVVAKWRRAFSTQQRMQLVVMAAVLAMAGTGQGCSLGCKLANITLRVESCGVTEVIETTECSGLCHNQDPNYIGNGDMDEQKICNGDWSYEAKHINGCPVAASGSLEARARSCPNDRSSRYSDGRFIKFIDRLSNIITVVPFCSCKAGRDVATPVCDNQENSPNENDLKRTGHWLLGLMRRL
ncbi:hypothetical protein F2P81_004215 [Scophthalmus maximus]|uniref:Glycoprotein hormone subunit beta domain-containing protein n=1 Tax=Scophthalmus maximus TaxID=52904 RepID=A0A6A4TEM8_SCOMX|nr:hypothetical protein F2P81_004215 [Scophthalmus maximus]